MQRLRVIMLTLLLPAFAVLAAGGVTGCGKDTKGTTTATSVTPTDKGTGSTTSGTSTKTEKVALEWKGTGTLKGQVTYDGDAPKAEKLKFPPDKTDAHCLKGEGEHQLNLTWEVDPNSRGVKNVVVWVRPADGKFFKHDALPEKARKRTDKVTMDQPFCNFIPHVQVFNPSIFDGKKQEPTGQQFFMLNSAPIQHNSQYKGNEAIPENSGNPTINPKGEFEFKVKPARDKATGDDLIHINCGIHPWMTAKLWALDTPYYAITDKDGKFEIKDVPAGAELMVIAWHEEAGANGFVLPATSPGPRGEKVTLEAGKDTEKNFKIKKQ